MTRSIQALSFLRFIVVGVANTAVGLAFIFAARALGLDEVPANAVGYAFGIALSFALNRAWTFRHKGPVLANALKFLVVMLLAWVANLVALLEFLRLGIAPASAQVGAVLPYTVVSYFGCRWWAFRNRSRG
jgi:putative flippase GtrA